MSQRSLAKFLARFPAILAAMSRAVGRAIVRLFTRVATAVADVIRAVWNLFARAARWLWNAYCDVEHSVVQVIVGIVLSIWSLRLLFILAAVGVALGYFKLWIWLIVYVMVMAAAIAFYFRMEASDEEEAAAAQLPLRELLVKVMRWLVRGGVAVASMVIFTLTGASSVALVRVKGMFSAPSTAQVNESRADLAAESAPMAAPATHSVQGERPTQSTGKPAASIPDVRAVASAVEPGIERLISMADSEPRESIDTLAKQVGRDFDFGTLAIERNRKQARRLNEAAIRASQALDGSRAAYNLQKQAMAADPLDVEVVGNLAIFAFQIGELDEARALSLYALGMPRGSDRSGRTADWSTLAAVYARSGDRIKARRALLVTLAIAPDVGKRCRAAVHAVKNTYGDVLREATQAMIERAREQSLSDSPDCSLPIAW